MRSIEHRLKVLREIKRPFSQAFLANQDDAYLVDSTFAFRIGQLDGNGRRRVTFLADYQLPILRELAKTEKGHHKTGLGMLTLLFTTRERAVYLGNKYKFIFSKEMDYCQLQSARPITIEPLPRNADIKLSAHKIIHLAKT